MPWFWAMLTIVFIHPATLRAGDVTPQNTPEQIFFSALEDIQTELNELNQRIAASQHDWDQEPLSQTEIEDYVENLETRLSDEFNALWAKLPKDKKGYTPRPNFRIDKNARLQAQQETAGKMAMYLPLMGFLGAETVFFLGFPDSWQSLPVFLVTGPLGAGLALSLEDRAKPIITATLNAIQQIWGGSSRVVEEFPTEDRRRALLKVPASLKLPDYPILLKSPNIVKAATGEKHQETLVISLAAGDKKSCVDFLTTDKKEKAWTKKAYAEWLKERNK